EHAVLRRLAGMERLAHGAEHRFEPGRLRPGNAERGGGGGGIEAEQVGGAGRRTEAADGRGVVEASGIMAGRDQRADAAEGLVAGDEGGHQRRAAGITGTVGCPPIVMLTSSKSSACDAAPLTIAACCVVARRG